MDRGARAEGCGQGWYLHLSWGDRADTFSTLWRALEESSSWGDPMSGPTPGEADRKHQKAGSSKASLPVLPVPCTAQGPASLPARDTAGAGLVGDRHWGFRGAGGLLQPGGLGQCRQRWVGTGQGACFSSSSKCGLAAVGPPGRQHMIPAAWG